MLGGKHGEKSRRGVGTHLAAGVDFSIDRGNTRCGRSAPFGLLPAHLKGLGDTQ